MYLYFVDFLHILHLLLLCVATSILSGFGFHIIELYIVSSIMPIAVNVIATPIGIAIANSLFIYYAPR